LPPAGYRPFRPVSLSLEPANITAVANDVARSDFSAATHRAGHRRMSPSLFPQRGSRNIVMALKKPQAKLLTVALLGYAVARFAQSSGRLSLVVQCD